MTEARAKAFMAVTEVDLANTSQLEFLQLHRREAIPADEAKEIVREEARTERAKVYQEFESAPEVDKYTRRIRDLQEFILDPATTQVEIDTSQIMIDTYTVKLKYAINTAHQGKHVVPVKEAVNQRTASWVSPNANAYSPDDDDTIIYQPRMSRYQPFTKASPPS